jgi:protein angel
LWQREKFELVEQSSVEFYQPGVDILNRDNIALVVRLKLQGSSDEIVVASTHLLYNPRREDVRLAQMQLLLAELDRVSHTNLPVILTGDFNLQPHTSVYQLLARGQFNMDNHYRSDCVPSHLGITDCCRHSSLLAHRQLSEYFKRDTEVVATELSLLQLYHTERKCDSTLQYSPLKHHKFGTGNLSHGLKLRSVHNHSLNTRREQEEASTHQDEWVTVDYIFYR